MLFSIIMPCFNRRDIINAAIESVFNQSLDAAEYELIVVDDGSTDGSYEFLEKYGDRIVLLCQKNQGPGAARNKGIEKAKGEYVCFLDSDDQWYPWTLNTYKQAIEKYNRPSLISSPPQVFENEISLDINKDQKLSAELYECFYETSRQKYWLIPGATCVLRSELNKAGNFAQSHINAEDTDLWLKLGASQGFVWIKTPTLLAYLRAAGTASKNILKSIEGIRYLIKSEKVGKYPGNERWQIARRRIILSHTRAASMGAIGIRSYNNAIRIYLDTLLWNIRDFRLLYVFVFLLLLIFSYLKKSK